MMSNIDDDCGRVNGKNNTLHDTDIFIINTKIGSKSNY